MIESISNSGWELIEARTGLDRNLFKWLCLNKGKHVNLSEQEKSTLFGRGEKRLRLMHHFLIPSPSDSKRVNWKNAKVNSDAVNLMIAQAKTKIDAGRMRVGAEILRVAADLEMNPADVEELVMNKSLLSGPTRQLLESKRHLLTSENVALLERLDS